jgi:hypothetical protein
MMVASASLFDLIELVHLATVAFVLLGSLRSSSGLMIERSGAGARRDWKRWSKRCKLAGINLDLERRCSERMKQIQSVIDRVMRDKDIIVVANMGDALEMRLEIELSGRFRID